MSAPSWNAAGSSSAGTTGSITPTQPTHATGHWLFVMMEGQNTDFGTDPAGYSLVGRELSGVNSKLRVLAKKATSGAEGNPTITPTSADHSYGIIHGISNAHQVHPWTVIAQRDGAGESAVTVPTLPGGQTLIDDVLYFAIGGYSGDFAGPGFSGETNADVSGLTERADGGTALGNGGGIAAYSGSIAAPSNVRSTSVTSGTATGLNGLVLAINPIADIALSGTVTVDGAPAPNSVGGDPKVYLRDVTQPQASYLVLDAATELTEYSLISGGSGAFAFKVPYNDHVYQAVYVDAGGSIVGASLPVTFSGSFPAADIEIFTTGGGGGGLLVPGAGGTYVR